MSHILYQWLFIPLETYLQLEWFYVPVCIAAVPYILFLTASRYARSLLPKARPKRHSRNYKHRCLLAYLSLGGTGAVSPSLSFTGGTSASFPTPIELQTIQWRNEVIPPTTVATFLRNTDALRHYELLTIDDGFLSQSRYIKLQPTDQRFKRILLEAKSLQTTIRRYVQDDSTPTQSAVYVSTKPRELPIVIDTGASCSVTPNIHDFIYPPTKASTNTMEGLNGQTTDVLGEGTIKWEIEDQKGILGNIETTAYYVPSANIRLFSPQSYIRDHKIQRNPKCQMLLDEAGISLTTAQGTVLTFPIQTGSNLPFMLTRKALSENSELSSQDRHSRQLNRFANLASFLCSSTFEIFNRECLFNSTVVVGTPNKVTESKFVLQRANWNLTEPQRELLLWHHRLGHINMQHVQSLLAKQKDDNSQRTKGQGEKRTIHPSNKKSSHCQPCPKCEACQYAKQKRRNPPSKISKSNPDNEGASSQNILIPGQRVSVDLYQSRTKGRLPHTFGKENKDLQYTGGALFVDHATRLVQHTHQFTTTVSETLGSKHSFEGFCDTFGIKVKEYVGDNNPFHSKEWKLDCANQHQKASLSGVGAHHQNRSERSIQTVLNMSRAMMLHFGIHWPEQANTNLWPFAVDHAVYLWNRIPDVKNRLSPLEHFTQTTVKNHHHLQRLHVFGCPVYVLDPRLQDGKRIPKWDRRSRQGIYLGVSPHHSSTVHLVLNPATGNVSPQYHVVFDDTFSTVFSDGAFTESVWDSLLVSNVERHPDTDTAIDIVPFQRATPRVEREINRDNINTINNTNSKPNVTFGDNTFIDDSRHEGEISSTREGAIPLTPEGVPTSAPEGVATSAPEGAILSPPKPTTKPTPILRKSSRIRKAVDRLTLYGNAHCSLLKPQGSTQTFFTHGTTLPRVPREQLNQQYLANVNWDKLVNVMSNTKGTIGSFLAEHRQNLSYGSLVEYLNPAAFITLANKEDNPTFKEAMASVDRSGFISAMETEIKTLQQEQAYDLTQRPKDHKVISGVWAFKRKRYPDGSIRKLKARYCARGFEQQQGVDYFETFAPVVM